MEKRIFTFTTLISILLLSVSSFAKTYKMENGTFIHATEDVNGKIDESILKKQQLSELTTDTNRAFELYENWPIDVQGNRGGYGITCNLDDDPELEIIFAGFTHIYAYNIDGTLVDGWPSPLNEFVTKAISIGDVNGDGEDNIILQTVDTYSTTGYLYAFNKDGSTLDGFPITCGANSGSPALADIDNDGALEIFVTKRVYPAGFVYAYHGDGSQVDGWPQEMDYIPGTAVSVGDITGDGIPEVVAESYYKLWVWDKDGNVLDGFPFDQPTDCTNSYSEPILVDLDDDGYREIVYGTHGFGGGPDNCYVIKNNGSVMAGWPKVTTWGIYSPPAIADIDNDGSLDIVIGDQVGGANVNALYAWDKDGNSLPGFPVTGIPAINIQPIVADFDNDGFLEIIVDDNSTDVNGIGRFWAYNHDGSLCEGFPLEVNASAFYQQPFISDVQNNGLLDFFAADYNMNTYNKSTYLWNMNSSYQEEKLPLTKFKYNSRRNGVYGDYDIVGINNNYELSIMNYELKQNYPNPFNPVTQINYELRIANYEFAEIVIHNSIGQKVWSSKPLSLNTYHCTFDGSKFNSGIYYYSLVVDGKKIDTKSMVLIK